jgi:hypothetical protein
MRSKKFGNSFEKTFINIMTYDRLIEQFSKRAAFWDGWDAGGLQRTLEKWGC